MAAGCLRIGRKAAQDAAPEGYGALVVGELVQPPGARETGQQLACEGEADAASAPSIDDEKLCNLMAALACVEPHQGEAGDLAADLGPPCRAPFSLAPVGVEAAVGKYAVDRLRAGKSGHVVDVELQITPEHVPLARGHLLDPDLWRHVGARRHVAAGGLSARWQRR